MGRSCWCMQRHFYCSGTCHACPSCNTLQNGQEVCSGSNCGGCNAEDECEAAPAPGVCAWTPDPTGDTPGTCDDAVGTSVQIEGFHGFPLDLNNGQYLPSPDGTILGISEGEEWVKRAVRAPYSEGVMASTII